MAHPMLMALAALLVPSLAAPPAVARAPLRVMTFNVRLPMAQDGPNDWRHRRAIAVAMIRRTAPDVIGTQELFHAQGADLIAALPGYAWFGTDRRGGRDDEHMGVFYRRDRLRLVDLGNFWLSDTPAVPGSISWGHPLPRMVTWGLFERIADRRRFSLATTHFPYRAEDEAARGKGAAAIRAWIGTLPADVPVVLTGDFNTTPASEAYRILTAGLTDVRTAAPSRSGPEETFHAFTGKGDRRIDWILTRGLAVRSTVTLTDRRGAVPVSDHWPVVADLGWRSP